MLFVSLALALILACNHGCSTWVAHALVDAPNAHRDGGSNAAHVATTLPPGITQELRIEVGPPDATLSLWIVDPPSNQEARGTILVLHGIRDNKTSQVGFGRALAAEGWRVVLVDLRGHGESTGRWLTYGIVESRDLVQALDTLQARGLLAGDVGVMGSSYGGSIGLQLAGIDPRVKAIVAVAPFANVHELPRCYARRWNVSWLLSDRTIDEGFHKANALSVCNLAHADAVSATANSAARVVLIHGKRDANIPFQHSERIAQAVGERAKLILLDDEDHVSIFRDRADLIQREAPALFRQHLAAN